MLSKEQICHDLAIRLTIEKNEGPKSNLLWQKNLLKDYFEIYSKLISEFSDAAKEFRDVQMPNVKFVRSEEDQK